MKVQTSQDFCKLIGTSDFVKSIHHKILLAND